MCIYSVKLKRDFRNWQHFCSTFILSILIQKKGSPTGLEQKMNSGTQQFVFFMTLQFQSAAFVCMNGSQWNFKSLV